jgi:hypothetical protein
MAENKAAILPMQGAYLRSKIRRFLGTDTAREKSESFEWHEHAHLPDRLENIADDDRQEAVEMLIDQEIGGIPVVDEAEGLVGL